jgi:uncharacterized protein YjlB
MNVLAHLLAAHGAISNHPRWPAAWRNGVFPFHHYHSNSHEALGVVGAYPEGQHPDTCMPALASAAKSAAAVARVPLPACDPVYGAGGPLFAYWR